MTNLKVGMRISSAVGDCQVMVIKTTLAQGDLRCAGVPMGAPDEAPAAEPAASAAGEALQIGKRYTDAAERIELLCVKPGAGPLTLDGEPLAPKQAKKLPSSD